MKRIPAAGACRPGILAQITLGPVLGQVIECSLNSTTT